MKTPISSLGKVAFVDHLTANTQANGDDAAIISRGATLELIAPMIYLEGIHFDLIYVPLKHLGYKAVVRALSNIYAMNGKPEYITVAIGLSARFAIEDAQEIYAGINAAAKNYNIQVIAGDTTASITGLAISITAIGKVAPKKITRRNTAKPTDLICLSGKLGAAYMGLKILEREKRALEGNSGVQPQLTGYEHILEKQLRPEAPLAVVNALAQAKIIPTAMIDITAGLNSAVLNLCHRSNVGARVMIDRLAIDSQMSKVAKELNLDPLVAILNGGDDYQLLFTVPANLHKEVEIFADIIGYITEPEEGANLITPDGNMATLSSPDFAAVNND